MRCVRYGSFIRRSNGLASASGGRRHKDPLTPALSPRGEGVRSQPLRGRSLSPWGEGQGEGVLEASCWIGGLREGAEFHGGSENYRWKTHCRGAARPRRRGRGGAQTEHGVTPGLAVVLVGDDPASQVYVRSKDKQTQPSRHGARSSTALPAETARGRAAGADRHSSTPIRAVHGILVQLPLPQAHRRRPRCSTPSIRPRMSTGSIRSMPGGWPAACAALVPCTPLGCIDPARKTVHASLDGHERHRDRPLQHRRQADGATAAARELHGDHRAFAHARSAGAVRAAPTC